MRNYYMMKSRKLFILMLIFIVFSLLFLLIYPTSSRKIWESGYQCEEYEGKWEIKSETTSSTAEKLPVFYYSGNNEKDVWLSTKINNVTNDDCIGFFSFQQQVEIFMDGKKIADFLPENPKKSNTPGNKWNFVPLEENDNGKTVTIHIYQCYNEGRITIPTMYFGTQAGIALYYLERQLPYLYLSMIMIFIGILISFFYVAINKENSASKAFKWLAFFAIFRGIGGYIEGNVYSLFTSRLLLISQISYLTLKIAITLYLLFINESFYQKKNKIISILTYVSISEIIVTAFLQFTGITDFATTIFISHGLLLVGGLYSCIDISHSLYIRNKAGELRGSDNYYSNITQLVATIIIISSSLVDMYRYYTTNDPDVAKFCRIGDFLFVMLVASGLILDMIYLLKMGKKAAIFKEQAFHDSMTKLLNRTRYERDMARAQKHGLESTGIIILDLNNLKKVNDEIGHDAGDKYIIYASKVINQIFAKYGRIYRIGGDEFCILTKNLDESKFTKLRTSMEMLLDADSNTEISDNAVIAIACGFAKYDPTLDESLHDTMKRADEEMYCRKKELKGIK